METMSLHSLHASRPSTFRAPGWGALAVLPSCRHWKNATSRKLVPFSHRSASRIFIRQPGCIPSPVVTQDGDHQFDGGKKRAGLRPLPRPQLQGSSSSLLGRRAGRAGVLPPAWASDPVLPPTFRVEGHPPAVRRRRPPAMRGKANCCCRARVQLSVLHPGDGRATRGPATSRSSLRRRLHNTSYVARAVLMFWDGLILVIVARTGVRTCRCASGGRRLLVRCSWAGGCYRRC